MNKNSERKRADLGHYIEREVINDPAVVGIVVIGSVAKGIARADSDIDAVVFLNPFDLFAVPAEAKWSPRTGTFHSIFDHVEKAIQLDFKRISWQAWSEPSFVWPESLRAELSEGWVAFDRFGQVQPLIQQCTDYADRIRQERLDDALCHLKWLLGEAATERPFDTLGPLVAHSRLHTAFDYLVQGIFAFNRRWRTLKSRELTDLMGLPWLPADFESAAFLAMNAPSADRNGYQQRVVTLNQFYEALVNACQEAGLYGENPLDEAFIRQHDEPGRAWNMAVWEQTHNRRSRNL